MADSTLTPEQWKNAMLTAAVEYGNKVAEETGNEDLGDMAVRAYIEGYTAGCAFQRAEDAKVLQEWAKTLDGEAAAKIADLAKRIEGEP